MRPWANHTVTPQGITFALVLVAFGISLVEDEHDDENDFQEGRTSTKLNPTRRDNFELVTPFAKRDIKSKPDLVGQSCSGGSPSG